ncbi:MAG: transglutaminase family protein, partial [Rubripirellula sp.]
RPFTVEMPSGRELSVQSIESSDRIRDLALIRVDVDQDPLPALTLSQTPLPTQGTKVVAFGNPLGMRDSVVTGIVSAIREIEGREMIQLAMPTQPGNSGGPLVDEAGKVVGIINMKSAIDDNLGFAIPIQQLDAVRDQPNPVEFERWVQLGRVSQQRWTPLFGANWQQRGGTISARGQGTGFGGRSLCLSTDETPQAAFEIAVNVRLNDESGAAGIAFHSDGDNRHYGFYPSAGQVRLTCFKGPSVYSWEVLEEQQTKHYLPNEWNHLRVRIEPGRLKCFINDHLVIESSDAQLRSGKFGLVKFRDTNPDFKGFEFGAHLQPQPLPEDSTTLLNRIFRRPSRLQSLSESELERLGESGDAARRVISKQVAQLEEQTARLRRLSADIVLNPILGELSRTAQGKSDDRLLRSTLLIAKLDDPDIDVDAYVQRVDDMANEVKQNLPEEADADTRRRELHHYPFEQNGFHGGQAEYYHRANSHLNRVIDDREGLPITLSILYMELGRRLDLRMEGIGLPGHFVVDHVIQDDQRQLIDVFERGALLSNEEAAKIVTDHAGRKMLPADRQPQSTTAILSRVLNNLIGVAGRDQDPDAIHRYCEALVAIEPSSITARRMRSQIRIMTDRPVAAIKDLDWLIENDTQGFAQAEAMRLRQSLIEQTNRN